ncbi:NlpC/P60 family protein [Azonexus sp.]|uniref:NlpC/P60 family protein n=1 Tax=Azonexus sp. TaxID=1872668 RepID=UPI0027B96EF2|nr:C40 family peptidase [Azonexus sp.]
MRRSSLLAVLFPVLLLAACGSPAPRPPLAERTITQAPRAVSGQAAEVVMYAMSLIDIGYRFGGKNPEAGLDCSGMVSYIFDQAAGLKVQGSAADIARRGRPVERHELRPGDLVFFNTMNRSFSHVGLYIGEGRFVHAPSTNGRVRIEQMTNRYFAQRFEAARTLLD